MDYLVDINTYKNNIKNALIRKGVEDMDTVTFSKYAEKIDELQLASGDTPSVPTPTPSADYIYSNGYLLGSDPITIVDSIPHEISLDENGKCIMNIMCPVEIKGASTRGYDIILTIDTPSSYGDECLYVEYYDQGTTTYYEQKMKPNPRHNTISRNGIMYNSWVREVEDGKDIGSAYLATEELQYRITIEKK